MNCGLLSPRPTRSEVDAMVGTLVESISNFNATDKEIERRLRRFTTEPNKVNRQRELKGTITVKNTYVEEHLLCSLHQQQVKQRSMMQHRAHRSTCERNAYVCERAGSPFIKRRSAVKHELILLGEAERTAPPRFRDVEEVITPRLHQENLRRRGQQPNAVRVARPASPRSLTATVRLPELPSLISPPYVSRVPSTVDRRAMLESVNMDTPGSQGALSGRGSPGAKDSPRPVSMSTLLREIGTAYEIKLLADATAHQQPPPPEIPKDDDNVGTTHQLMPVLTALHTSLGSKLAPAALPDKIEQLRMSCAPRRHHGWHPRVALFRLYCWGGDRPWTAAQDIACMRLLSWLNIASSAPIGMGMSGDVRLLLPHSHAAKLAGNLKRLGLIAEAAVPALTELANKAVIAPEDLTPQHRGTLTCDADELLLVWMQHWGSWLGKDLDGADVSWMTVDRASTPKFELGKAHVSTPRSGTRSPRDGRPLSPLTLSLSPPREKILGRAVWAPGPGSDSSSSLSRY